MWSNYDEEEENANQVTMEDTGTGPLKAEYLDIIISDVRTRNVFSFSIQILNTEGDVIPESRMTSLTRLQQELRIWRN